MEGRITSFRIQTLARGRVRQGAVASDNVDRARGFPVSTENGKGLCSCLIFGHLLHSLCKGLLPLLSRKQALRDQPCTGDGVWERNR